MPGKVIAIANMKGGVGKTTTVVGLAEALAASQASVLVIDLDPQASASMCLAGDDQLADLIMNGRTLDAYLEDRVLGGKRLDFQRCVCAEVSNVTHKGSRLPISLLASSPYLRVLERELIFDLGGKGYSANAVVGRLFRIMRTQLERAAKSYDFIIMDCAPGVSALTEVGVRLADLVIVPTIPDFLSSYGLQAFCNSLWKGEIAGQSPLAAPARQPHVLVARRRQTKQHNAIAEALRGRGLARRLSLKLKLFDVEIPETTAIATALGIIDQPPPFTRKWGAPIVQVWERLAVETKETLNVA